VLSGAGVAFQQAALGHVARATGEPLAAAGLNLTVGLVVLVVVALVSTGGSPPGGWSAPPLDWIGGVVAAVGAVVMATTVGRLGVLQLMLAVVAGQSIGALVLDLVAPPAGESVTALKFVSLALVVAAVVVSGLHRRDLDPTPVAGESLMPS
jgi:transporter family-2 protein